MKRYSWRRQLILLFLCVSNLLVFCSAQFTLRINVHQYHNPGGRDHAGACCDVGCGGCDSYFLFCLREKDYPTYLDICPWKSFSTGTKTVGGETVSFPLTSTGIAGVLANPLVYSSSALWPGSFQLLVRITDADPGTDDLIDRVIVKKDLNPSSSFTATTDYWGENNIARMRLSFKVTCNNNYYGIDCGTYCVGQDGPSGHYTCGSDGLPVCLTGYTDTSTSCITPICASGCHSTGGMCNSPGECICNSGWYGSLCDQCTPATGCVNGACSVPGECNCDAGYSGSLCNKDEDVCGHVAPCSENSLSCTNTGPDTYECQCMVGYTGMNCEEDIDECVSNLCQNGATCNDLVNAYECICATGWKGTNCETNIDECTELSPCQNGATCNDCIPTGSSTVTDAEGTESDCSLGYTCDCRTGYYGDNCELDFDYCQSDPCQHGGLCHDLETGHYCVCPHTHTGPNCETEIDECDPNPCVNGDCTDALGNYTCACYVDYTGQDCNIPINNCQGVMCQNWGVCIDGVGEFTCSCIPGYTGRLCETDIDECDSSPCFNGGTCSTVNLVNDFYCDCTEGFTGPTCEEGENDCHRDLCFGGGTCVDLHNDYMCICVAGRTGRQCENTIPIIDGCDTNPCASDEYCEDAGDGSYVCNPCGNAVACVDNGANNNTVIGGDSNTNNIVGGVVGGVLALLLICCLCCILWCAVCAKGRRRKKDRVDEVDGMTTLSGGDREVKVNAMYFDPNVLSESTATLPSRTLPRATHLENPLYSEASLRNGSPHLPLPPPPRQHRSNSPLYEPIPGYGSDQQAQPTLFQASGKYNHLHRDIPPATPSTASPVSPGNFSAHYSRLEDSDSPLLKSTTAGAPRPSNDNQKRQSANENPYTIEPTEAASMFLPPPPPSTNATTAQSLEDREVELLKEGALSAPIPTTAHEENPYETLPFDSNT